MFSVCAKKLPKDRNFLQNSETEIKNCLYLYVIVLSTRIHYMVYFHEGKGLQVNW